MRAVLVASTIAAVLAATASAATITAIEPRRGGVNGQTRLTVSGTGFDIRGRSNDVFIGTGLNGVFCDPIPNECTDTRIVCLTDAFHGGAPLPLSVRSFGFLADCQVSSGCTFEYTHGQTPEVQSISPEWAVAQQMVTVTGTRFSQGDPTVANFDFTMHLGEEERCELMGQISSSAFRCLIHSMRPGPLPVDIVMGASGRATIAGTRAITLYPELQAVEPALGSMAGGTTLTLTGTSFSPELVENQVLVHGKPCVVTAMSEDRLYCRTAPSDATATPARTWTAGQAKMEIWYDLPGNSITQHLTDKLQFNQVSETRMIDTFGLGSFHCENCAARITTHFVAPASGNFTFTATGDDGWELWIADDENPIARRQELPENSSNVLDITPFHSKRCANGYYSDTGSCHRVLVAGQRYWMQAWVKQGTGGMGMSVTIRDPAGAAVSIPSAMTFSEEWAPPVQVTVRETPAKLADTCTTWGSCSFNYAESATPTVSAVSGTATPGSTLTITGTGFDTTTTKPTAPSACADMPQCGGGGCACDTNAQCGLYDDLCMWDTVQGGCRHTSAQLCDTWSRNRVTVGGAECQVTAQTATELQCRLGFTAGAGSFPVVVRVGDNGVAAGSPLVTVTASIRKIVPAAGSINGGNSLTIVGSGFDAEDGVTTVTVGGANCPVSSITSYTIVCLVPAGTAGSAAVAVQTKHREENTATYSYTYSTPMTRPGITRAVADPTVAPRRASLGGGTSISIEAPAVSISMTSRVAVTFGGIACDVTFALGSYVTCRTRGVNAPRAAAGLLNVTDAAGVVQSITLPTINFVRSVTYVYNRDVSAQGSTVVDIRYDGFPVPQSEISVSAFGAPCDAISYSTSPNRIYCRVGPKPTAAPTLPVVEAFDFTQPAGSMTDPLHRMDYSTGVRANTDGSVTIPAGAHWLMTKRQMQRPFVFKAKVRASRDLSVNGGRDANIAMRVCVTENSLEESGYRAVVADTRDGRFAIRGESFTSRTSTSEYTAGTDFASVGLDSSAYHDYKIEINRRYIRFYIDNVLIRTADSNSEQVGSVGFGHSGQAITVRDLVIEDLYPQSLQVNISGQPLWSDDDLIWTEGPKISSFRPSAIAFGTRLTIFGDNFGSSPYEVYAIASASAQVTSTSPRVCRGDLATSASGTRYFTCTVDSVPAGSLTLAYRSGDGKAATTGTVTYQAAVTSVTPNFGGAQGKLITIAGGGFTRDATVTIGSNACPVLSVNDEQIICLAPAGSGSNVAIGVQAGGAAAAVCSACRFTYNETAASITAVSVNEGGDNTVVTFTGTGFETEGAWVRAGEVGCSVWRRTETELRCTMGRSATTGNKQLVVHFPRSGRAAFASGVSSTFRFVTQATGVSPSSGSVNGGQLVSVVASNIDTSAGATRVAGHTFSSTVEAGWSNAPSQLWQCNGRSMMGPFQHESVSKTFTGLAAHQAVRIAFDLTQNSADTEIVVAGTTYAIERTECEYGWVCGASWSWTCRATGSIVVPHTGASLTVTFRGSRADRNWGMISYEVSTIATLQQQVTIGGNACPIALVEPSAIRCRTPAGTGSAAVAVTSGGATLCSGCTFYYAATATPTVSTAAVMELPGMPTDAATRAVIPPLATRNGVIATYTAEGARVWKAPSAGDSWNGLASSPRAIARPTSGTDGVAFVARGTCAQMIGLSSEKLNENGAYASIDFALYLRNDAYVAIYERGTHRGVVSTYRPGDAFAVYYDSACRCVKYAQGGVVVYQSDSEPTFPLFMAASLHTASSTCGLEHLRYLQPRAQAARLVLSGTGMTPSDAAVTVAGTACLDSYVSNGVANCWVAQAPTANFDVVVSSSLGAGSSVNIGLTAATASRPSDASGSVEGGHELTILGTGFTAATTVTIGSACTVTAWTATSITCVTSAHAAGSQSVVVATGATTHTCVPYMGVRGWTEATCEYTYAAAGAAVTGVTGTATSGATVTVTGTGFATGSKVMFGSYACNVKSLSATSVVCTLPSMAAGAYSVRVVDPSAGFSTTTQTADVALTANAPSTTAVGNLGGARVTITGANFGTTETLSVTVGTANLCASVERTVSQVVCVTSAGDFSGALTVTVAGRSAEAAASFTAAAANVATVTSVAPTSGGAGSAVTVMGTNLEGTGSIIIGGVNCAVFRSSPSAATCMLAGGAPAGAQTVTVRTDNRGTGTGSASFNVRLMVSRVTPARGPNAGGRLVTVFGSGFSTTASLMRVRIAGAACAVQSSTATSLTCTTGMVPDDNNRTDVSVAIVDPATVTPTASASSYTFDTSLTATVTAISPASGSAAGMETLTITGTGFSTTASENVVRIGGTVCNVESASATQLTCLSQPMAINAAAAVDVVIRGQGRASQSTPVTFAATFNITGVSGSAFSVEGGATVTFTGTGFWTFDSSSWRHRYYSLKIGGRACAITSATATALHCTLPAAPRPFVKMAPLVSQYPLKPDASNLAVTLVANGKVASVAPTAVVSYTQAATPRVTSVSPSGTVAPGTAITLTGTGFAASGNAVRIGSIDCPVTSQSTTQVVCTVPATALGSGFIRVLVPGVGLSTAQLSCPAGEYLMCDGSCVRNQQCVYEEWGMATCPDLSNLIIADTFCHANGGTDRVNIPFRTDSNTVFDLNCPMYSCEGGDCDQALYIGGRGGRVSTCGQDPSGHKVEVRPVVSSLSASTSSIGGGRVITITGSHFGTNASQVIVSANGAVCAATSVTDTQIVCETSPQVRSRSQLLVYVRNVMATCSDCTFTYADWDIPTVTDTTPTYPRSGSALTITGTNFGTTQSAVTVHIGARACPVTSVTATSVVCTAPQLPIGTHSLRVNVATIGSSSGATVTYRLYVKGISHERGSTAGGHVVTIQGTGFSANTRARIGSCETDFVRMAGDDLVVRTRNCTGTERVYATQGSQTSNCDGSCTNYAFVSGSTPAISAASVTGSEVTLTVSNLNGAAQVNVSVSAGSAVCAITAFSATSITCTMGAHHAGRYPIVLHDVNQGISQVTSTSPTFTFTSTVSSFAPASGARGGRQNITVTGTGFGASAANLRVMVGTDECKIRTASNTEIVCTTQQTSQSGAVALSVTPVDSRMLDTAPVVTASSQYTFDAASPVITSIVPNRGSTAGGTAVTIGGTGLSSSLAVTIDGVACSQSAGDASATTATIYYCTTGAHRTLLEPVPVIAALPSNGGVAWVNASYQYIDLWSRWTTWGNTPPPVEGDSAVISEGQTVMVDYNPPRFYLVIVMGHLIFDDTRDINFDCTYVMINFGRFTVGTPEKPYRKRAVITLHGDRLTPEIPVHGAKVIALRHGALDMHGIPRQPTWTRLADTANAGAATIQVRGPVDWKVGEFIVVAPTDYEFLHAEHRMITGVTPADGQAAVVTLQLEYPLEHLHFGRRQCFGTGADEVCVDEIAEVGLLTRNILIRGDKNSMRIGFGGTMFLMPLGHDENKYARLSYVEFAQVGQQFIVGRYPVHYHVTHVANNSYVNGTAVHESLNRAFSIHGVHNNTYVNNVAYDILGHAFFIEDGSERYNVIENNMVSVVKSTTSNLNTDVTPANFWIVSPTNIIRNNAACGGHAYGYWISPFHPHSTGPTHSPNDCPASHQMTDFSNNVAHSNRKYGLNIFRFWWPKAVECDFNSEDVPAYIRNHLSYKNHIHGITMGNQEAGEVGSIIVDNYTAADNGLVHGDGSAYWIEKNRCRNMTIGVQNSRLIALTNNQPFRRRAARRGINLPEGDNFFTENVTFVNYNGENHGFEPQAWAERMSLCFPWGWEAVSRGLKWIDSPQRVNMRFHHHGVLADDDGTLTGEAGSQVIAKSPLFDDTICRTVAKNTGYLSEALICPNRYKIRRFGISTMNEIWTWQRWINGPRSEEVPEILRKYLVTAPINHSIQIDFQWWKNPASWDWRFGAFKFLQPGERQRFWTIYNESRHHVYGTFDRTGLNRTWWLPEPQLMDPKSGYRFDNETMRYTGLLVYPENTRMSVTAHNCPDEGCPNPPLPPAAWDQPCRSFTNPGSWTGSAVPNVGASLHIRSTDAVCMDGLSTPGASAPSSGSAAEGSPVNFGGSCSAGRVYEYSFFSMRIEGSLQLLDHHCPCDGAVVHMKVASNVWIRNGGLLVGNSTHPLTRCKFRLSIGQPPFGDVTQMANYRLDPWGHRSVSVESGMLRLIGAKPQPLWARLAATANAGATTLSMDQAVSWRAGMTIAIAGTTRMTMYHEAEVVDGDQFEESEKREIASVSADGRTVTLTAPLTYSHYGSAPQTLGNRTYNIGAEVIVFDRQICLDGGEAAGVEPPFGAGWKLNVGCTDGTTEGCGLGAEGELGWPMRAGEKAGFVQVDGTLFRDVGQAADQHGSVEFDGLVDSVDASGSFFRNNAFDRVYNTGIFIRHTTRGLTLANNTFFNVSGDAIRTAGAGNVVDGNVIIRLNMPIQICDKVYFIFWDCRTAGVRAHSGTRVVNNVVASGKTAGFITDGDHCTAGAMQWANNMAHSTRDGLLVANEPAEDPMMWASDASTPTTCRHVGGVTAYWIGDQGLINWYGTEDFKVSDLTVVEATVGLAAILMYPPANVVGTRIPTATYENLAFAGFWNGQSCRSASYHWTCKKSLLDSKPWCSIFHKGHGQQHMGVVGLSETVFTSSEFGGKRTKGEQKFRFLEADSYATIGGQVKVNGVHFANFDGNDGCGLKNVAFHQNPYSNDTFHQHEFRQVTWGSGIEDGGEFFARTTYGDTHHPADQFTPTWFLDYDNFKYGAYWPDSPNHVMLQDVDGSFTRTGRRTSIVASETLVRNDQFSRLGYDGRAFRQGNLGAPRAGCTENAAWNAFQCDSRVEWTSVVIDNLAEDRYTRRPGPLVMCKGDGMIDVNGWPLCQGGNVQYASGPVMKGKEQRATLERMTRWWFHAENGGNHTLNFRGQPPENMRLYLQDYEYLGRPNANIGVTLNLRYHGLNSQLRVGVYVNGVRQRPSVGYGYPWEQTPARTWPSASDPAGTHYHDKYVNAQETTRIGNQGVQRNVLSFVLRPGSVVDLRQEPVVQVSATLSMPLNEFFNNKDTFPAAMASTLGIAEDRIKFAKIVPGTTRRRQGSSTTEVTLTIDQTAAAATAAYNGQAVSDDLSNVASTVNALAANTTQIGSFQVTSMSASVQRVVIPVPPVNIARGTPYMTLNASRAGAGINATVVRDLMVTYARTVMNATVAPEFNVTASDEVALTNVYTNSETGVTRAIVLMLYENGTQSFVGLQHLTEVLSNSTTAARVLPGYTIHHVAFEANGFGDGSSSSDTDLWSVEGSVLKFAVGIAVGLLVVCLIGGIVLYCCVYKRTAEHAAQQKDIDAEAREPAAGADKHASDSPV